MRTSSPPSKQNAVFNLKMKNAFIRWAANSTPFYLPTGQIDDVTRIVSVVGLLWVSRSHLVDRVTQAR
jgi:hypothetical protein